MKILFFIFVSMSINAFGSPQGFECTLADYGQVHLSFIHSGKSQQRFDAYIGTEKWSNPYAVTKACELVKSELIGAPTMRQSARECYDNGRSTAETQFIVRITRNGSIVLGNEEVTKLLFRPTFPIAEEFLNLADDPTCDSFDPR